MRMATFDDIRVGAKLRGIDVSGVAEVLQVFGLVSISDRLSDPAEITPGMSVPSVRGWNAR